MTRYQLFAFLTQALLAGATALGLLLWTGAALLPPSAMAIGLAAELPPLGLTWLLLRADGSTLERQAIGVIAAGWLVLCLGIVAHRLGWVGVRSPDAPVPVDWMAYPALASAALLMVVARHWRRTRITPALARGPR